MIEPFSGGVNGSHCNAGNKTNTKITKFLSSLDFIISECILQAEDAAHFAIDRKTLCTRLDEVAWSMQISQR